MRLLKCQKCEAVKTFKASGEYLNFTREHGVEICDENVSAKRWFNVVMGDRYETDTGSTDRMADRIPLPQAVVDALAFDLRVFGEGAPQTRSQNDKARPH